MRYQVLKSGENYRREYFGRNRSQLFYSLPKKDFGQEQKNSYASFIQHGLKKLFSNFFPKSFSN